MMNVKRIVDRAREILKKENTFRLFTKNTVCAAIVLLFANTLFAQYSNATLNGPWFVHSVPFVLDDQSFMYWVFDGNGHIVDGSMFATISGNYSVSSSGALTGNLIISGVTAGALSGQFVSNNLLTAGTMVMERIANPGALTDSLVGTITSGLCGTRNIVLRLNSQGQIISSNGLTTPVSGRVYTDSGIFLGHLKTGDTTMCITCATANETEYGGSWDEFSIWGTYSNDSLNGVMSVDGPTSSGCPGGVQLANNGTVHLARQGTVTSAVVKGFAASASKLTFCTHVNSGIFTFSLNQNIAGNLQIVDISGKIIHEELIGAGKYSARVDLSRLSQGVYFYRVQSKGDAFQGKILIK